jgi:hypothetical protein
MLSHGLVNAIAVTGRLSLIDAVTNAIDVQVAKNNRDLGQEIVILSQLHVINVQLLCDLDRLAVRWNTTDICSIFQGECKSILIEIEVMSKMGTPVLWCFSADESKIQDVVVPKDVDQHRDSTDQSNCPPPVDCNGQEINMSAFPIQQPHPDDLHLVCHLIERSPLLHINHVFDHHEHMFVTHNIAHLLCKGHLDDILALFLFHRKLATLKEDNTDLIFG